MKFCVRRLVATPRKHRIETVMCSRAREDWIGMHENMNDVSESARQRSWEWKTWEPESCKVIIRGTCRTEWGAQLSWAPQIQGGNRLWEGGEGQK